VVAQGGGPGKVAQGGGPGWWPREGGPGWWPRVVASMVQKKEPMLLNAISKSKIFEFMNRSTSQLVTCLD
jgi:hypothetical protein